jgi:hypothetical protein
LHPWIADISGCADVGKKAKSSYSVDDDGELASINNLLDDLNHQEVYTNTIPFRMRRYGTGDAETQKAKLLRARIGTGCFGTEMDRPKVGPPLVGHEAEFFFIFFPLSLSLSLSFPTPLKKKNTKNGTLKKKGAYVGELRERAKSYTSTTDYHHHQHHHHGSLPAHPANGSSSTSPPLSPRNLRAIKTRSFASSPMLDQPLSSPSSSVNGNGGNGWGGMGGGSGAAGAGSYKGSAEYLVGPGGGWIEKKRASSKLSIGAPREFKHLARESFLHAIREDNRNPTHSHPWP